MSMIRPLRLAIRWKLLLLMLIIAVGPLIITAWLDIRSLGELGARLAIQSGQALGEQARASLEQQADDYTRLVNRERQLVELLVRLQALEVQRALNMLNPPEPPVHWVSEFDSRAAVLALAQYPDKYYQLRADGSRSPIPVSLRHAALYAAPGIETTAVTSDASRLASLASLLAEVHRFHSDLVYWQYTALESGLHASFPGHGGYPANFDPRQRNWYTEQKGRKRFNWSRPQIDVTTRLSLISATMPLFDAHGDFIGVTGIDVRITSLLRSLQLPRHLATASRVLLTVPSPTNAPRIAIIARQDHTETGGDWQETPTLETFALDDPNANRTLAADIRAKRDGFMRTSYQGQDSFCAYRRFGDDQSYLILLVPTHAVTQPATAAAQYALVSTQRQIDTLLAIALVVILGVAILAYWMSTTVTVPIAQLYAAVKEVSKGRFDVRVDITSGDELERLGRSFNAMVPQLEEHTRDRESMALAREVQQQLLPRGAPQCAGLDIAGVSHYCDQTGGDYYDFIDLRPSGSPVIGVAIGDVAGHGVAAALLMTSARALLHGFVRTEHSPPAVLDHINQYLIDDVYAGHFMTLFFLTIDMERRMLQWAGAGHDAAMLYRKTDDAFSELAGRDIPVGVDREWQYRAVEQRGYLQGDIIVLGTDGIWETQNPGGERFGKERLLRLVRDSAGASSSEICARIVTTLAEFRGGTPQRDDVTAVVIRIINPNE